MIDEARYGIKNPLFDLLCFMQTYDDNGLDDPKFTRLLKNIRTNFNKLYLTVDQIFRHKEMHLDLEKSEILRCQLVEYGYLKISTIWDISYQIADSLLSYGRPPKGSNKYDALKLKFEKHNRELGFLQTEWYWDINKIRNKVVHGGINVMPFYVESELMFNTYDANVDSVLSQCSIFTVESGSMASAGRYFMYYLGILYQYLCDFFAYVLVEISMRRLGLVQTSFDQNSGCTLLSFDSVR